MYNTNGAEEKESIVFSGRFYTDMCRCDGIGSFSASAACGRRSEAEKGAAVESLSRSKRSKLSGTARVPAASIGFLLTI